MVSVGSNCSEYNNDYYEETDEYSDRFSYLGNKRLRSRNEERKMYNNKNKKSKINYSIDNNENIFNKAKCEQKNINQIAENLSYRERKLMDYEFNDNESIRDAAKGEYKNINQVAERLSNEVQTSIEYD